VRSKMAGVKMQYFCDNFYDVYDKWPPLIYQFFTKPFVGTFLLNFDYCWTMYVFVFYWIHSAVASWNGNSIFHVIKMFFHCTHYLYNIISKLDESLVSSYILICIIDFKNVNSQFLTGHFNYLMSKTLIQTWIILICLRHPKAVFTLRA
jgi:hypothetical protein